MNQHRKFTKEYAAEAVALLHSSGRTRREVADNLGIGLSTLARWLRDSRDRVDGKADASSNEDIVAELKRLRRENDVLRQERDILKKATVFFAKEGRSRVPMIRGIIGTARDEVCLRVLSCPRHAAMLGIDQAKDEFPIQCLCKVLAVSQSGYFAYRRRSASKRQRGDMVMLAHVRSAFSLSNGTYGRAKAGFTSRLSSICSHGGWLVGRRKPRFQRNEGPLESAVEGTGDRLHRDLALAALRKALIIRCPPEGLIHHSDRGSSQIYADCVNLPAILFNRLPS